MKKKFLLLLIVLGIQSLFAQNYTKKELKYKPLTLEEAVELLSKMHSDSIKRWIMNQQEDDFIIGAHRGLGMWMRNKWGLWGGGKLVQHFEEMDVFHPDNMSSMILRCYYRDLKGLDWGVEEQIKFYQKDREEMKEHLYKLEHDPEYAEEIRRQMGDKY